MIRHCISTYAIKILRSAELKVEYMTATLWGLWSFALELLHILRPIPVTPYRVTMGTKDLTVQHSKISRTMQMDSIFWWLCANRINDLIYRIARDACIQYPRHFSPGMDCNKAVKMLRPQPVALVIELEKV